MVAVGALPAVAALACVALGRGDALTRGAIADEHLLFGRVVDERGDGVGDAFVRVVVSSARHRVLDVATTPDGRFVVGPVPYGRLDLTATAPRRHRVDLVTSAAASPLEVVLRRASVCVPLEVRVVDPDGLPLVGAAVELGGRVLRADRQGEVWWPAVERDDVERFEVRPPDGRRDLGPSRGAHDRVGHVVHVRMSAAATVEGTVTDPRGRPVGWAVVWYRDTATPWWRAADAVAGRFVAGPLARGPVHLVARTGDDPRPTGEAPPSVVVDADARDVALEVVGAGWLDVRLPPEAPLRDATAALVDVDTGLVRSRKRSEDQGSVRFFGLSLDRRYAVHAVPTGAIDRAVVLPPTVPDGRMGLARVVPTRAVAGRVEGAASLTVSVRVTTSDGLVFLADVGVDRRFTVLAVPLGRARIDARAYGPHHGTFEGHADVGDEDRAEVVVAVSRVAEGPR